MTQCVADGSTEIPISTVRAALQKIIKESRLGSQGESCTQDESVARAAPLGNSISSSRGYANWRARSIIREIASLRTPCALIKYEVDLREMIYFQEVRRRTRILNDFIQEECFLTEKAQVERLEKRRRAVLVEEWWKGIALPIHYFQFLFDEEVSRYNLVQEEHYLWRDFLLSVKCSALSVKERKHAAFIQDAEKVAMDELQQRHLIEVGQEVRYEILRRSLADRLCRLHRDAISFTREYKNLLRAEERDRLAIEKISFFSFDILIKGANYDRARALREDVDNIRYAAKQNDQDIGTFKAICDRQDMIQHETQIRQMLLEAEEQEWQQVYYSFMIGWRDVYQRISAHSDVTTLVSSLELFERRCVHDQYRHSLSCIASLYESEHRMAQLREKRYWKFFDDLITGMNQIWVDESTEYAALKEHYIAFEVKTKVIHSTKILLLKEAVVRKELESEELQQRIQKKIRVLKQKCDVDAMNISFMIISHEAYEWDLLMYSFQQQFIIIPQREMIREEFLKRLDVESEEEHSNIQLVYQQQVCRYRGMVSEIACRLLQEERKYRYGILEKERSARKDMVRFSCMEMERQSRRALVRGEKHCRIGLTIHATEGEDLFVRDLIFQQYTAAVLTSQLEFVQNCEVSERSSILKSENNRRNFLISSMPYEHLYLRACEVEELAGRLDIITDAELCMRSCAFTYGHDAFIAYCDHNLRMLQAQLHFQSLSELFQENERQLVCEIEPMYRRKLEETWLLGVLVIKVECEEGSCRQHLCSLESSDWDSIEKLSTRIISRQVSLEQRVFLQLEGPKFLPFRDELLQYLQKRQDPSYLAELSKKKRKVIRSAVSLFMEELYWSRDSILRMEEIARYSIMYFETEEIKIRYVCDDSGRSSCCPGAETAGVVDEERTAIYRSRPQATFLTSPTLFVHSVAVLQPTEKARRVVGLSIFYSGEPQSYCIALHSTHQIRVGGKNMEVLAPSTLHSWLPENAPCVGVVYFTLLDESGEVVATASHLLQEGENDILFLSVELDNTQGRVYLAKCMKSPENNK